METNRRGWAVLGESEGSTEVTSVLMVSRDFSSEENAGRFRERTAWAGLEKFLDFWAEGAAQNLLFVTWSFQSELWKKGGEKGSSAKRLMCSLC